MAEALSNQGNMGKSTGHVKFTPTQQLSVINITTLGP